MFISFYGREFLAFRNNQLFILESAYTREHTSGESGFPETAIMRIIQYFAMCNKRLLNHRKILYTIVDNFLQKLK